MGTKRESRGGEQHTSKKQTSTRLLELPPASRLGQAGRAFSHAIRYAHLIQRKASRGCAEAR